METATNTRGLPKYREGIVVSNKMDKTIVVAISKQTKEKYYGKYMVKTKKQVAHDAENQCAIGDRVKIVETRPLSKNKRWKLVEVLVKAK
jgi:small subunit ribosomal protein S17